MNVVEGSAVRIGCSFQGVRGNEGRQFWLFCSKMLRTRRCCCLGSIQGRRGKIQGVFVYK